MHAKHQLVCDDAYRPPIRREAVPLVLDDLWREVLGCTTGRKRLVIASEHFGKTKVNYPDVAFVI